MSIRQGIHDAFGVALRALTLTAPAAMAALAAVAGQAAHAATITLPQALEAAANNVDVAIARRGHAILPFPAPW